MLTAVQVRQVKPGPKRQRLWDGGGLYLEVTPAGGKLWRLKYRFTGKEKLLALGRYPAVRLSEARLRTARAREALEQGIDPSATRKAVKQHHAEAAAHTFKALALEWYAKQSPTWAPSYGERILRRLERDIFPWLGDRPIAGIGAPELLAVIRRIEGRGVLETAHRALFDCGRVFRYAVASGRAERDPSHDIRDALQPVGPPQHFAAPTDPTRLGELLVMIDGYKGSLPVAAALKLQALLFVRPGELRRAQWRDLDLKGGEWRFVVSKTRTPHVVPLARQAVALLEELAPLTGTSPYVFPSARSLHRPLSENAVLAALRRLGIPKEELCGHGFRAVARTLLEEVLGYRPDYIEQQLAHTVRDPLGRAYNRTTHLDQRRLMMQAWADYLDGLKAGASGKATAAA